MWTGDLPTVAHIGLGSNLGDSLRVLREAWHALGRRPRIRLLRLSSPYRTRPVGMASRNWFINAAGSLRTDLQADELLAVLLGIEERFGRRRDRPGRGYLDRELDLDLLLFGECVRSGPGLTIPHPEMHRRLFVLRPLCEIAPEIVHPLLHRAMQDLLLSAAEGAEEDAVRRISWPDGGP